MDKNTVLCVAGAYWNFAPKKIVGVRFEGIVPHSRMPLVINSADIVVLPSKSESFSCIAAEALACNKPVIAPMHSGLKEIYNGNGLTLNKITPGEIAEKISLALSDIGHYESVAHRQLKKSLLSWGESVLLLKKEIETELLELAHRN